MKKPKFLLWQVMFVLSAVTIFVAIMRPLVNRAPQSGERASCQSNLKQIAFGIRQYIQDYNQKFPPVNAGKQGWADMLQPYLTDTEILQCPSESSGSVEGKTDYFYNANLAGFDARELPLGDKTIMNGDGLPDAPRNVSYSKFPAGWVANPNSPAYRHLKGANYSYADGHVKWMNNAHLSDMPDGAGFLSFYFAPWLYP